MTNMHEPTDYIPLGDPREIDLWNEDMVCSLISMSFDYLTKTARVYLVERHKPDQQGTVKTVRSAFPTVETIEVYSGRLGRQLVYRKVGLGMWKATDKRW
ncbi:hypothetical protein [Burkholderia multivorans]|uniref:hypothetical protein n=1 Tax=Burkholderia multivorans TaxID=87883 RepID=UPI0021BE31E0|nr:hypothetical protein [Burkholderia multivorans]